MRRRLFGIATGVSVLVAIGWLLLNGGASPSEPGVASGDATREVAHSGSEEGAPPAVGIAGAEMVLLPHAGNGALPESVRIGVGRVSADDAEGHARWVLSDQSGSGAQDYSELATIESWVTPFTQVLDDGRVKVGPVDLPADADRVDLRARGADPLVFYLSSFTPRRAPTEIAPTLAAGLRIIREPVGDVDAHVLLRRVSVPEDAAHWQLLMADLAPEMLAAYDDAGMEVSGTSLPVSPLPPGRVGVVLMVNGVEAQQQSVDLVAGAWTDVRFDALVQETAAAMSATAELQFVVEGSNEPIEGIEVTWYGNRGDLVRVSDAMGQVRFAGIDRLIPQRFSLTFPGNEDELQRWPENRPLELSFDTPTGDASSSTIIHRTIALSPLLWLKVRTGNFPLAPFRQAGNPYPIFVLQQELDGEWLDVAADFFRPMEHVMAVSIQSEGRYRMMAMASPWTVYWSQEADIHREEGAPPEVSLLFGTGHPVDILVTGDDGTKAYVPIDVRGAVRGLPRMPVDTDGGGRLRLSDVTVAELRLEAPGYRAVTVDTRATHVKAELERDADPVGDD